MKITLLNGENVRISWNWLVIERIEEEIGSFAKLEGLNQKEIKDALKEKQMTKIIGNIVYAIVQANLDKEYGRDELIRLIEVEDFAKIMDFIQENEEKIMKVVDTKK